MTQHTEGHNIEIWTKVTGDEDGLVSVGEQKQIRLSDLQKAISESLGQDSVSGIFGGQFRFKVQVPHSVILERKLEAAYTRQ